MEAGLLNDLKRSNIEKNGIINEKHSLDTEIDDSEGGNAFLYLSAITANLIAFSCGLGFAWSSPVLPKLNGSVDPELNPLKNAITPNQESWIAGLLVLGACAGPIFSTKLANKIGRKPTLLILALPMIFSFILSAFAKNVELFYLARFVLGIGVGGAFSILPIYLNEIARIDNRGTISFLMSLLITVGLLVSYIIGPIFTIQIFCFICCTPLLLFLVVFGLFIPESPVYLATIGDFRRVKSILLRLRGGHNGDKTQMELQRIKENVQMACNHSQNFSQILKNRPICKGLIITLSLMLFQQFTGINVIISYMQQIFESTNSGISSNISTNLVGLVQVVTVAITSTFADKCNRRVLLILSSTLCGLSLANLGLYFYLDSIEIQVNNIFWLPISSIILYVIAFNFGFGTLPWTIMAEISPANVAALASATATSTCFGAGFLVTLLFPPIVAQVGMACAFWIFAFFALGASIFIYFAVPETRGKSLQEIQDLLIGKK